MTGALTEEGYDSEIVESPRSILPFTPASRAPASGSGKGRC
jgi:hypothetical protein